MSETEQRTQLQKVCAELAERHGTIRGTVHTAKPQVVWDDVRPAFEAAAAERYRVAAVVMAPMGRPLRIADFAPGSFPPGTTIRETGYLGEYCGAKWYCDDTLAVGSVHVIAVPLGNEPRELES